MKKNRAYDVAICATVLVWVVTMILNVMYGSFESTEVRVAATASIFAISFGVGQAIEARRKPKVLTPSRRDPLLPYVEYLSPSDLSFFSRWAAPTVCDQWERAIDHYAPAKPVESKPATLAQVKEKTAARGRNHGGLAQSVSELTIQAEKLVEANAAMVRDTAMKTASITPARKRAREAKAAATEYEAVKLAQKVANKVRIGHLTGESLADALRAYEPPKGDLQIAYWVGVAELFGAELAVRVAATAGTYLLPQHVDKDVQQRLEVARTNAAQDIAKTLAKHSEVYYDDPYDDSGALKPDVQAEVDELIFGPDPYPVSESTSYTAKEVQRAAQQNVAKRAAAARKVKKCPDKTMIRKTTA